MDVNKKTRTDLKQFFKINDKPTQEEFSDLIDATINQAEDGIAKIRGNALSIEAEGEPAGSQGVLDLYTRFTDENPQWSINLNPRLDPQESTSGQPGFNIKDITGLSRFFIKSGAGNVGFGTIDPTSKVTIEAKNTASLLSVIDSTAERTTILEVTKDNGVAIKGKFAVEGKVEVVGALALEGDVEIGGALEVDGELKASNISTNSSLNETKSNTIPTQKAVKTYIDTRLPKGLISMWSGETIPVGWALCDGQNNTPDLSGRFIVGQDKQAGSDYKIIGQKGGLEQVTLAKSQIPAHTHSGRTADSGNHNHSFYGAKSKGDGTGTGSSNDYYGGLTRNTASAGIHNHSFTTDATGDGESHENRPPYFVLAYIMKL